VPPVFARSQSPPPPTVWDRFAPAVRARRPPCHVPGAMRSGRERRLRPWGCDFQTSLASATSWAVASIAALRPEPTEGGGQGRGNSAQPSEPSVPGPGRSFPEGKLWGVHTTSRDRLLCPRTPGALTADRGHGGSDHHYRDVSYPPCGMLASRVDRVVCAGRSSVGGSAWPPVEAQVGRHRDSVLTDFAGINGGFGHR